MNAVDTVKRKVLRPSLLRALQGAPDKLKNDEPAANPWLDDLERRVDAEFFPRLWIALEAIDSAEAPLVETDQQRTEWARWLIGEAEQLLEAAFQIAPIPSARRLKAIASAESLFHWAARHEFPSVFEIPAAATQQPKEARQ